MISVPKTRPTGLLTYVGSSKGFLLLVLLLLIALAPARGQEKIPKKAHKYFVQADYDIGLGKLQSAKEYLLLAIKAYPDYTRARLYLADIHFQLKDYEKALVEYERLKENESYPHRVDQFIARSYFAIGDFDECISSMETYLLNEKISPRIRRDGEMMIRNARFSKQSMAAPLAFTPVHLGEEVNSSDSEYMPSLNADESTVIFTRLIRGQEDLYITSHNGKWEKAKPMEEGVITTGHNEGAHCISADGQVLLYTICNEKYTKGSCDLYISKKQDDGWSTPKNIGPPVNSVAWDS
ncbi:MAG: tetratricopeptide repeat protein, partial [Bacteroidetes bacterium]|nr:tetratricopeptide repeat protein [Bacteroidota bacterium]